MTRFCKTHVGDRSLQELLVRAAELLDRDLDVHPGLRAEYDRVAARIRELRDRSTGQLPLKDED